MIREVSGGSGIHTQNSLAVEFGLAGNTTVNTLEVRWPTGVIETASNLSVDQKLTIVEGPPSTPTGFWVSGSYGQSPTLHWNANPEPDIKHYNIYRKIGSGSWSYLDNTTGTQYTDNTVTIRNKFYDRICYKIQAEDYSGQTSSFTGQKCVWGELMQKLVLLPGEFILHPNTPNPFNPITTIKYDLPEDSFVQLKIYDVMGREVRILVNATVGGGYRTVIWDGRDNNGKSVPSGMYIYTFKATSMERNKSFSRTRKMVLLR